MFLPTLSQKYRSHFDKELLTVKLSIEICIDINLYLFVEGKIRLLLRDQFSTELILKIQKHDKRTTQIEYIIFGLN